MERCSNCPECGLEISYDPNTATWGPRLRIWRSTCTNRAVADSEEKEQANCENFNRALALLIY